MVENNFSLVFKDKSCIMRDCDGLELMTVEMKDKCFYVECKKTDLHAYTASLDKSALWHKRLGHFSYGSLKNMSSLKLEECLPDIHIANEVFDVCQ